MLKHNTNGSRTAGYQQEPKLKLLRWVREGLSNAILTNCKGMLNYQSHCFIFKFSPSNCLTRLFSCAVFCKLKKV
jgi:hypothetical protein